VVLLLKVWRDLFEPHPTEVVIWTVAVLTTVVLLVARPTSLPTMAVHAVVMVVLLIWASTRFQPIRIEYVACFLIIVGMYPVALPAWRISAVFVGTVAIMFLFVAVLSHTDSRILLSEMSLLLAIGSLSTASERSSEITRRTNARLLNLVESSNAAIVVVDLDHSIQYLNAAGVGLFGYNTAELIGQNLTVLLPERFHHSHAREFAGFMGSDRDQLSPDRPGLCGQRKDGEEFPIEVSVSRHITEGDSFAMAIVRDTSVQHELTAALKEREASLTALVASRSELIASVSHELRTPLTMVMGYVDLMIEQPDASDQTKAIMLRTIAEETDQLSTIIEDLVTGAQLEAAEMVVGSIPVDLGQIVRSIVHQYGVLSQVHATTQDDGAVALGDPFRIRQIVRNLLINAIRHGGPTIGVSIRDTGAWVEVELADDGAAISNSVLEQMFEPFASAHRVTGVTAPLGLGLTISRNLAQLMDGELDHRRNNERNIFTLTLPRSALRS